MLHRRWPASSSLLLTLATVIAWLPSIRSYIPLADDNSEITWFREGTYIQTLGVWRILGCTTPYLSVLIHPYFHSVLAIILNTLAVLALYQVFRRQLSERIAFTLALIFGVFPWGFQAVLWASSLQVVAVTLLFALNLLVLARERKGDFVLSFIVTLISYFVNDYLIFATMISGLVLALTSRKFRYAALAPILSGSIYLVLYRIFSQQLIENYKQPSFNFAGFVSPYFYQWTNVWVLEPLLKRSTLRLMFFGWSAFIAIAVAVGLGCLAYLLFRQPREEVKENKKPILNLAALGVLLLSASSIYALTGGYSLDSRKKYALVPFCLMAIGWVWQRYLPMVKIGRVALTILMALGFATTWTIIGIWRYEEARYQAIVNKAPVSPSLHGEWPHLYDTVGFRFDDKWVLDSALKTTESRPRP